jgi:hypothetical protein
MAEFCKKCSIDLFGLDTKDFAGIAKRNEKAFVLCEGCGYIWVDHNGVRLESYYACTDCDPIKFPLCDKCLGC